MSKSSPFSPPLRPGDFTFKVRVTDDYHQKFWAKYDPETGRWTARWYNSRSAHLIGQAPFATPEELVRHVANRVLCNGAYE